MVFQTLTHLNTIRKIMWIQDFSGGGGVPGDIYD